MRKSLVLFVLLLSLITDLFGQEPTTIRVGVFLDMSGQTSTFGIATKNGIALAVAEINKAGGINGQMLEIFLEDDEGRPDFAEKAVKKLIAEHQVHVLIGDVASTNSLAAGYIAQEEGVPMITPSSTNPKVTQFGDYIFRACYVDPFQGDAMAKFAFNELKLRRVAIFSDADSDYSRFLAEHFRNTFRTLGGKISIETQYEQADSDYKTSLRTIRRTKPDGIYLSGYYGQVSIIARQSRKVGMRIPLLGGDGWDSPELWKLGGDALRNSYISNHFASDNPAPEVQGFLRKYKLKYQSDPDTLAALGYDTVYLFTDALRRANSTKGPALRDALAATVNFFGVTGKIARFDHLRNPIKPVTILKSNTPTSTFLYDSTIEP